MEAFAPTSVWCMMTASPAVSTQVMSSKMDDGPSGGAAVPAQRRGRDRDTTATEPVNSAHHGVMEVWGIRHHTGPTEGRRALMDPTYFKDSSVI